MVSISSPKARCLMADNVSPETRSRTMRAVKGRDTAPELALRQALRGAGLAGYRVHVRTLPGSPDIAYTRWRVAVFVDGAFWHGDPRRWHPERASDYWRTKINRNQARDRRANQELAELGWIVVRVWDTDLARDPATAVRSVAAALIRHGHP